MGMKTQLSCDACGVEDIPKGMCEPVGDDICFIEISVKPLWAGINTPPYLAPDCKQVCTDCFKKMWDVVGWGND